MTPIMDGGVEVRPLLGFEVPELSNPTPTRRAGDRRRAPSRVGLRARRDGARHARPRRRRGVRAGRLRRRAHGLAARRHPANPGAWLTTAARRSALNALRAPGALRRSCRCCSSPRRRSRPCPTDEPRRSPTTGCGSSSPAATRRSRREAQVALTLRLVCGCRTRRHRARLPRRRADHGGAVTRAKKKIAAAHIPYPVPGPTSCPHALDAVLTVVHLLYTTGHAAPSGAELVRGDLVDRALELARLLVALLPGEPEARGLLALLAGHRRPPRDPHRRRRPARAAGGPGPGAAGTGPPSRRVDALVVAALAAGPPGRFALQAAIASLHAHAPSYDDDRLAPDRPALRRAGAALALAGRRPQPRHRAWRSTARRPAWPRSRRWRRPALAGYRYLPAHEGRPAAPPRPAGRGGRRLPRGARAGRQRGGAGVPAAPVGGLRG